MILFWWYFLIRLLGCHMIILYLFISIYQHTLNIVHPCNMILWLSNLNGFAGKIFHLSYTTLSATFERVRAYSDVIFCSCKNWRKGMFNSGETDLELFFQKTHHLKNVQTKGIFFIYLRFALQLLNNVYTLNINFQVPESIFFLSNIKHWRSVFVAPGTITQETIADRLCYFILFESEVL